MNNSKMLLIKRQNWHLARIFIISDFSFMSTPKLVKCGVTQGTILGPLLFLLYINDLPDCLYFSQPRMYADDTSLAFASVDLKHIGDCLNYDLNRVYKWLSAN